MTSHDISIEYGNASKFMLHKGHRACCTGGWSSDCYAQLSDARRASDVHLRRAKDAGEATLERSPLEEMVVRLRSDEEKAFMRGFGTAIASLWRSSHNQSMIKILLQANGFTRGSFDNTGLSDWDLEALRQAVQP